MDTREWIFILGVIAVVIIALVAAARWRRQRFEDISPGKYASSDDAEDSAEFSSDELPGGGARTVGYRDPNDIEKMNVEIRARAEASKPRLSSFRPEPVEQQSLLLAEDEPEDENQEEAVPLLLDPSEEHNLRDEGLEPEPSEPRVLHTEEDIDELEEIADELLEEEPELELNTRQEASEPEKPSQNSQSTEPGEIIIINLMTEPAEPYEGDALLKVLHELGMRHGDMDIFHYCGRHGDEAPQFRMANLLKPGYFDIHAMDQTRTHALCFFFELLADQDNMQVYESMLSVINKVRDELGGELHDENRSVFTIQTSEHCRNRIRDFQRRHLLAR